MLAGACAGVARESVRLVVFEFPVAASDEGMSFSRFESWKLDGHRING